MSRGSQPSHLVATWEERTATVRGDGSSEGMSFDAVNNATIAAALEFVGGSRCWVISGGGGTGGEDVDMEL